jgi:hypothetical protein
MSKNKHPDSEIIDLLGGTSVVAKFTNLTTGAISQWRTNGMPDAWKKYSARMLFARARNEHLPYGCSAHASAIFF